jgi:hypothetical protein
MKFLTRKDSKKFKKTWLICQQLLNYLSYIYLGSSVCHIPVIFRSYSCHIPVCRSCGTLIYSFSFNNQTDQGETRWRVCRGRDFRDGEIGDGEIEEGGCEETFHCKSLTWETCRFTVPSAVDIMNFIGSGLLWWIFCQTGTFRGVFSLYISFLTLGGSAQQ